MCGGRDLELGCFRDEEEEEKEDEEKEEETKEEEAEGDN